jgi:small subunit ribosomal protein S11
MGKKRVIKKGEDALQEDKAKVSAGTTRKVSRKATAGKIPTGRIYIYSSYNNTLMSLTDSTGNVVAQVSAGAVGFKGTKKSTPFAASKVAESLTQIAKQRGMEKIDIYIKGVGSGRDSALRSLGQKGFDIGLIRDVTPVPHNGPRRKKVRHP